PRARRFDDPGSGRSRGDRPSDEGRARSPPSCSSRVERRRGDQAHHRAGDQGRHRPCHLAAGDRGDLRGSFGMKAGVVTNKELEAFDDEDRRAWLASMTPDERIVVYFPRGYRFDVIIASYTKFALTLPMGASTRLEFLESLDKLTGEYFNSQALAAT